jgi:hypothetical protein
MDRQSDRLPRQTRCEGMRIKREIQMGASGGGQSIKASGIAARTGRTQTCNRHDSPKPKTPLTRGGRPHNFPPAGSQSKPDHRDRSRTADAGPLCLSAQATASPMGHLGPFPERVLCNTAAIAYHRETNTHQCPLAAGQRAEQKAVLCCLLSSASFVASEATARAEFRDFFEVQVLPARQRPVEHACRCLAYILEAVNGITRYEDQRAGAADRSLAVDRQFVAAIDQEEIFFIVRGRLLQVRFWRPGRSLNRRRDPR